MPITCFSNVYLLFIGCKSKLSLHDKDVTFDDPRYHLLDQDITFCNRDHHDITFDDKDITLNDKNTIFSDQDIIFCDQDITLHD